MDSTNRAEWLWCTIEIGGSTLAADVCEIDEGMSEHERVYLEVSNAFDVDFGPLMETDAIVVVSMGGVEVRRFVRKLASATFLTDDEGKLHYGLELRPAFWFLEHSMNTRKEFRDMTTEAIVDKVLGEEGIDHTWRTTRSSKSRPYCVQYRETTRAFVERLLEYEGFYFSYDEAGTLVIGDTSSSEPMVDGPPLYELVDSDGAMAHATTGVTSIWRAARISSGHATVNDHNFKTPYTSLLATAASSIDADLEVYDYPVGYREQGVGDMLAKLRLDALTAEKRYVEGTSNVAQFASARIFEFTHTEAIDWSGSYFLVRVEHRYQMKAPRSERRQAVEAGYENTFFAIPSSVAWRPTLRTPHPVIQGNHTATVRGPASEEIHTDVYGRAKVQFHWDREANGLDDSRWIRVLQETSSSMVLSRVGWEIVVGYIDGDPDRPVGVGRNMNGKMMPMYGQPDRKNIMTIKTESYPGKQGNNELRIDDTAGAMRMDFHAQRDHTNTVENDRTEKITNDHFHLVKLGLDRAVAGNQVVTIGANETKDVQLNFTETVKSDRTENIGGSEKVDVKVVSALNVEKNEKVSIGSVRFTLAGLGSVSLPSPKFIAQTLVPHTLGASFDDMASGGTNDGGANAGHVAGNLSTGGALGANTAKFGGEGTFGGFGALGGFGAGALGAGALGGGGGGGAASGGGSSGGGSGLDGLLSQLSSGGGAKALSSAVTQAVGGGAAGAGVGAFTSGLASGGSLDAALGQGLAGAAGKIGGPAGDVLGALTSGKGPLGSVGSQLASGNLSGAASSLGQGLSGAASNLKSALTPSNALGLVESMLSGTIVKDTRQKLTRTIGAAHVVAAGGAIMYGSNYVFTELVGGLKMSVSATGSVMQSASKFLIHTVGGMILRKSQEAMSYSAKKSAIKVGAEAKFHSDEKLELRGKVIELEGKTRVSLKSGDLLIQLEPSKITIKGDVKTTSADNIKISGSPDKLTA